SSMLEILRQDYIRTARAKGASEASVNFHHALKNAILPVITVVGIEAAFLIGGLIVTETVFNIPGVARFLVEAIRWRAYPFVLTALFADLICRYSPLTVDSAHALAPPGWQHWMGTDSFGRDVWARIIHGARISLAVGIGSTALGSSIGVIVGLTSGYLSGWVDLVFQRVT